MTTPSHVLRETILDVLSAADPQPVRLQELYRAVEQRITLDAEDLASFIVRGAPANEPAWKRNVRNVLQQSKRAGTLLNITYERWRSPALTHAPNSTRREPGRRSGRPPRRR